ncbi:MAG: hypothetical protein DME76_07900 [Verrucomicrobia bacterium]|nr:MAG: hypothetical protein DME76_07900 [Verrucomicrobiota bacterium]
MRLRRWNKWSFIARLIPAVPPPCAVLDYFFAANFGSRCLGPSVEEGIVGIGPTVMTALRAFDAQYLAGLRPPSETVSTASALRADAAARRPYRRPKSTAKSRAEVSGPPGLPERELPSEFGTAATAL